MKNFMNLGFLYKINRPNRSRIKITFLVLLFVFSTFITGLHVLLERGNRVTAGAGAIEHYSARRVAEQTVNGPSAYTYITGTADSGTTASTYGWVDSSNLTPGEKYLIMVWGSHNTSSTSGRSLIRVVHGGTEFDGSLTAEETDQTGSDYKTPYYWFTVWEAVEGEDIDVQFASLVSGLARVEDITLVVMNAEALIANGDLVYNYDTAGGALTSTYVAKSSISWTPSHNNDTWWISGYVRSDIQEAGGDNVEFRLNIDSGTIRSSASIEGENTSDSPVYGIGWAQTFTNALHSVDVEIRETAATQDWDAAGVFALRLDVFEDYAIYTETGAGTTLTTTNQWYEQGNVDPNPTTQGNWLIAAGGIADDYFSRIQNRLQLGGSNITDDVGGFHHSFTGDDNWVPVSVADVQIDFTTGSKDIDFDSRQTEGSSGALTDRWVVAFSMERVSLPAPIITQEGYVIANDDGFVFNEGLTVNPVKIDDAGNPGPMPNSSRQVVRDSVGNLYATINDGGSCEIWKSDDGGSNWTEQSPSFNPLCTSFKAVGLTIDSSDNLWMTYQNSSIIYAKKFTTSTSSFGTSEAISGTLSTIDGISIAIDGNDVPHIVADVNNPVTTSNIVYSNRVGGSWASLVYIESETLGTGVHHPSITINEDNIPEISYIQGGYYDLTAAVGDDNDPDTVGQWTLNDVDTSINMASNETETSIATDDAGNTWIAFVDENGTDDYITIAKHDDASGWSTGWNTYTNSNAGYEPSIVTLGDLIYVFYEDKGTDDIAYDVYDGSTWRGETVIHAGTYQDVKAKWASLNDNGSTVQIDYLFSDNTDIYWSKLYDAYASGTDESTVQVGSNFSSDKSIENSAKGELYNIRLQLTNSGGLVLNDPISLFYDRGDNIWTKVESYSQMLSDNGSGCDNAAWTCEDIVSTGDVGEYADIAFDNTGMPWVVYYDNASNYDIYVARWDGTQWNSSIIESTSDSGTYASIAITDQGYPVVSYYVAGTSNDLRVAEYVTSGGTGCTGGNTKWSCTTVKSTDDVGKYSSVAINKSGNPVISYYNDTSDDLEVAVKVGSGGSGCATAVWICETVDSTGSVGLYSSLSIDALNNYWVAYFNDTDDDLVVAVNKSGSGCASSSWTCTDVVTSNSVGQYPSIAIDPENKPWISYHYETGGDLYTAEYVGTGGSGCADSAWDCNAIVTTNDSGEKSSLAFDAAGHPWISYYDNTDYDLELARFVESGGSGCANSAWECTTLESSGDVGDYSSIGFDFRGNPWIAFNNETSDDLEVAKLVRAGEITIVKAGSAINGSTVSESHADMTSPTDTTNQNDADCIASSTNWVDGKTYSVEEATNLGLSSGETTKSCTEIQFSISTFNAVEGQTYRFIVSSKDNWEPNKNVWRGPKSVTSGAYPEITVMGQTDTVISKSSRPKYDDLCNNFDESGGAADWLCTTLVGADSTSDGRYPVIDFTSENIPWAVYKNYELADDVVAAVYVGDTTAAERYTGQDGPCKGLDVVGQGSDSWQCYTVFDGNMSNDAYFIDMAIDKNDIPWIVFRDQESGTNQRSAYVAHYVGSGGNCDSIDNGGSDAWECERVFVGTDTTDDLYYGPMSIVIDAENNPWITFHNYNPGSNLVVARRVGSGGNCNTYGASTGSSAWHCETMLQNFYVTSHDVGSVLEVDSNGTIWAASTYGARSLFLAKYVGEGGGGDCSGETTAWQCEIIYQYGSTAAIEAFDMAFDANDNPILAFDDPDSQDDLIVATYVGSGGSCTNTAWQCTEIFDGDSGYDLGYVSITADAHGTPYVAFLDREDFDNNTALAWYVGSGGNCDGFDGTGGSDAWQCETIFDADSANDSNGLSLAFDKTNTPWIMTNDEGSPIIMRKQLPGEDLSYSNPEKSTRSGETAHGDIIVSSGLSSRSDGYGNATCGIDLDYGGLCGIFYPDGILDSIRTFAGEMPLYNFSSRFSSDTEFPSSRIHFQTNLPPNTSGTVGDIKLQIYRHGTTNAWVTLATDSTSSDCTSNCVIEGTPDGNTTEYYRQDGSDYWVDVRLYQNESPGSSITLSLDGYKAWQTVETLRHGRTFRDLTTNPFIW